MSGWLNYHHLFYFWVIAQEGSVSAAAKRLRLSQPTLSAQLKTLEEVLETELFSREGRRLTLTRSGQLVRRYAQEIFSLGSELQAALRTKETAETTRLRVGITDSLPKLIAHSALLPLHSIKSPVRVECYDGKRELLLSQLGSHDLDVVVSDAPFSAEVAVKAYNHLLLSSPIGFYGTPQFIKRLPGSGVAKLAEAPYILPTGNTMLRRTVDGWFERRGIEPKIIAEFEDSALLESFAAEHLGLFPMVTCVESAVGARYGFQKFLQLDGVKEDFFIISLERKVRHPALIAMTRSVRKG